MKELQEALKFIPESASKDVVFILGERDEEYPAKLLKVS